MALSRKRRKELNRLKGQAEDLWEDQKELLDHASKVVRDASRHAALYAREEVAPRVRDTFSVAGCVHSLVPVASPVKFATVFGA